MSTGRINLGDLKSQIAKRVGPDRTRQYFGHLNQLLSQKLSKPEFNNLLLSTLGRENLHLHNQLVQSVFRNACQAKTPPPSQPPLWSNGDVPQSPRRSRSGVGARRIKDRPSPLGQQLLPHHEETVRENGVMGVCDLKRPLQQHQDGGTPAGQPAKRPRRAENASVGLVEAMDVDWAREDSERRNDMSSAKVPPLQAPLGIPFCHPSIGGARRNLTQAAASSFGNFGSCSDSGELSHTEDLRRRMERIAEGQGLGGVELDCANLLNNGLNAYLKRLIKSSVELVGARSGHRQTNQQQIYKHQIHEKPINGVWQGNHVHLQGGGLPLDGLTNPINRRLITVQDFRVAMELNPRQLGEDWPLLLEKICHRSLEE